jgi:hypothetical protein
MWYCPSACGWYYWYGPKACYLPVTYITEYPPDTSVEEELPPNASEVEEVEEDNRPDVDDL